MLTSITVPEMTDLITRSVDMEMENAISYPLMNSGLFRRVDIADGTGNTRRFADFDVDKFARRKTQGNDVEDMQVQYGYEKDVVVETVGFQLTIDLETRLQDKSGMVPSTVRSLAASVPNRMELDMEHRLGFGFATSYQNLEGETVNTTVSDGLALFSSVHTLAGSATTYSNIVTGNPQLSEASLALAENVISQNRITHLGQKMPKSTGKKFIILTDDRTQYNLAKKIVFSGSSVLETNSGVMNPFQSEYEIIQLPYMATNAEGVSDSTKLKYWGIFYADAFNAVYAVQRMAEVYPPSSGSNGEDATTRNWVWVVIGMYGIATLTGRGCAFSKGDGT